MVESVDSPRLEHVRVNVSDFGRAVAWYESILELPAQGHWPPEAPTYAHFPTGAAQFAISKMDPVPAAGRYNFSVRDVDAWWEKLRDRADVVEPLFDTAYGTRKFTVRDPDGNELGFVREDTPAKRRWGYYVLPIVFGDRFVGRIEPRIDRDGACVEVINVWWEDDFAPRRAEGFVDGMRDALRAYLRFAGSDRLDWAPHLSTEKRLFLTRP